MNEEADSLRCSRRPLVSIVLAVLNEERYIEATIRSLLEQETADFDLEICVVDGKSTDRTFEIVRRLANHDHRVRLLLNEKRKTPAAFNIGLHSARGEYVCIFGAHAEYAPNYISVCLHELHRTGSVGCSGVLKTVAGAETSEALAIAWTLGHPFGSSSRSVRTQKGGFVDSIPFPVFRREPLLKVGGYDETLHRNQDNDLNQRLRSSGYQLYLTERTYARYAARTSIAKLVMYAYRSGYWNYISIRRNAASMAIHHFVPAFFVVTLAAFSLFAAIGATFRPTYWLVMVMPLPAVLLAYLSLALIAAIQIALHERSPAALLVPVVMCAFHASYGVGTIYAFLRRDFA